MILPVMAESKESLDIASNEYENVEVQQVQEKESQKNSLENVKVDEQSQIYMDKDEVKEIYPNIEKFLHIQRNQIIVSQMIL